MAVSLPPEMTVEGGNPILDALPPKSDYITYLTILEYQLTPDRLPSLQKALEDDSENALTENIGWDLVQLLLPMLPQSERCLDLVARKGNPKEVIIRVTEALESIANAANSANEEVEEAEGYDVAGEGMKTFDGEAERIHLGEMKLEGMPDQSMDSKPNEIQHIQHDMEELSITKSNAASLPPIQFSMLLSMLAVLHPRIKTKSPSRFLATSLQAMLRAYRGLIMPSVTAKVVELLTKLSGRQRPALPPRTSTAEVNQLTASAPTAEFVTAPLADPEEDSSNTRDSTSEEADKAIVKRLLQAVALEVLEDFVIDAGSAQDSGMGWTTRLREQLEPHLSVPGEKTVTERFRSERELRDTDLIVEKLVRLCSVLDLNHPSTFAQILSPPSSSISEEQTDEEPASPTEYPTSPSQIPFSNKGILFYLSALCFDSVLSYYKDIPPPSVSPQIFPDLSALLTHYVEPSPTGSDSLPQCPVSVLDSLLSLFYLALQSQRIGAIPHDKDRFKHDTWQPILHLSAQHPIPEIRFFAHYVSTQLLFKHASVKVRFELIIETLSLQEDADPIFRQIVHEPLRSVAIGWAKNEVRHHLQEGLTEDERTLLLEAGAADELAADLFPDAPFVHTPSPEGEELNNFVLQLPFYTATLNFGYYLLSLAPDATQTDLGTVIQKLKDAYMAKRCEALRAGIEAVEREGLAADDEGLAMELRVCEYALEQVENKL
ncbi:MAG: hypothetical protein Q9160_000578 [Pyrenula sp. 1 TL-2023]